MLRAFFQLFSRRPSARPGRMRGVGGRSSRLGDGLFESFVNASGCLPPRRLTQHDARLRRLRWLRRTMVAGLTVFGAWVAIESAQALALF